MVKNRESSSCIMKTAKLKDVKWKDDKLHGKVLGFSEKGEATFEGTFVNDVGTGFRKYKYEWVVGKSVHWRE